MSWIYLKFVTMRLIASKFELKSYYKWDTPVHFMNATIYDTL